MIKKTWYEKIIEVLQHEEIPLQRKDIVEQLAARGYLPVDCSPKKLSIILGNLVNKKKLCIYKVKGFWGFYCIPSWFITGQPNTLKPQYEIDPYTKQKIHNEPEDNTVGVSDTGISLGRD